MDIDMDIEIDMDEGLHNYCYMFEVYLRHSLQ